MACASQLQILQHPERDVASVESLLKEPQKGSGKKKLIFKGFEKAREFSYLRFAGQHFFFFFF